MNFGFELEVRDNAGVVLDHLRNMGVTSHAGFHAYHCRCEQCDYSGYGSNLFLAQQDCTVDGEIISVILRHGSAQHHKAVNAVSRAMLLAGAETAGNTGLHVHVERDALTADAPNDRGMRERILYRLMYRYGRELRELAAGSHRDVRDYNGYPEDWERGHYNWQTREHSPFDWNGRGRPYCGSWLVEKEETNEFRLWNSTRVAWRLNLAIGLSVAMTRAAADCQDTTGPTDPRPIEAILAPYMDPATFAAVLRQRYAKGGVAR